MKRTGFSLLEVLISVFILTIGLLSVISLIPVGTHNMLEATKLDRGAAVGRSALREVKTMGLLNPRYWCDAALRPNSVPNPSRIADMSYVNGGVTKTFAIRPTILNSPNGGDPLFGDWLLGQTFMIDPLGIARYYDDVNAIGGTPNTHALGRFPYIPGAADQADQIHIPRLSVNVLPLAPVVAPGIRHDFFKRFFVCADDSLFHVPEERDARSTQQFTFSDGGFSHQIPDPSAATASDPIPVAAQSEGHYSWLLTAVPIPSDTPQDSNKLDSDHQRRYRVSTAVFYKRNYDFEGASATSDDPRAERRVLVKTLGGGDVRLMIDATTSGPEALALKKNEWLMLFAVSPRPGLGIVDQRLDYDGNPATGVWPGYRKIAHWFRIVSLDQEPVRETLEDGKEYWTRYVTLAGPDWDSNTGVAGSFIPAGLSVDACAFLIDNVISVHTTELEVE